MTADTEQPELATPPFDVEELLAFAPGDYETLDGDRLRATPPTVLAGFLARIEVDQRRDVLRQLSEEAVSEILAEMEPDDTAEVVGAMRQERALKVIEEFDPDDAADVFGELEDSDRTRLLEQLEPETAEVVKQLLTYDPETAGGIMTTEFASIGATMTIDGAIRHIRALQEEIEDISYVYVVDDDDRLVGVVSMRDLILARKPGAPIDTILIPTLKGVCGPETDREEVALRIAEYNLMAVPVVDADGHMLGIVTVDDVIDILQSEATEDLQKLVGAGGDEGVHDPVSYALGKRHPWLQVNLATAFLASGVIFLFQQQIEQLTLLAVFMPIVASMGGNTGAQTLAVAIRGMALGEVQGSDAGRLCRKELILGLLNGLSTGAVAALAAWLVVRDVAVALVVLAAMVLNMGIAGLSGAYIPLLLKRLKLDPAQSSSIFLTTVTDVAGFFIFLSLGTWILL